MFGGPIQSHRRGGRASGAVSSMGSLRRVSPQVVDAVVTHRAMPWSSAPLAVWIVGVAVLTRHQAVQVGAVFGLVYGLGPATAAVRPPDWS